MVVRDTARGKIVLSGASAPRVPATPWLASLLVHGAAALALLALRDPGPEAMAPARIRPAILLAPFRAAPSPVHPATIHPETVHKEIAHRPSRALPARPAAAPNLRRFNLPAPVIVRRKEIEALPLPSIETPAVPVSLPETERIATAPPPPLKTDNLASALVARAATAPPLALKTDNLTSAPASQAPTSPTAGVPHTGLFGAASAAADGLSSLRRAHPRDVTAGFGDATIGPVKTSTAAPGSPPPPAPTRPVEILSKPRPAYSEEARRQRIEGEVLVEVLFTAAGEARVIRLVRGLGRGLDENALAAAQSIRFRPAERAGTPVDSTAVIHIVFQLAY